MSVYRTIGPLDLLPKFEVFVLRLYLLYDASCNFSGFVVRLEKKFSILCSPRVKWTLITPLITENIEVHRN